MNALERLIAERGPSAPAAPSVPAPRAMDLILARVGLSAEAFAAEVQAEAEQGAGRKRPIAVPESPELLRIVTLPRRPLYTRDQLEALAEAYTNALKTPHGTMRLRPLQALALHELRERGGVFAPMRVGSGKTLVSWLALIVTGAKRPLLLVPAALRDKTRRDFRVLAQHWIGPPPDSVRVESYEYVSGRSGRVELGDKGERLSAGFLDKYEPDLLILDEVQKVSRPTAAVTKRVKRFMKEHPGTRVCALSGTITKRSLRDYAHVLSWCLPENCPLPLKWEFFGKDFGKHDTLGLWADALDEKVNPMRRLEPGALLNLAPEETRSQAYYGAESAIRVARQAYRSRLIETPGVVASQEVELAVSLSIRELLQPDGAPAGAADESEGLTEAWAGLRERGETPDGSVLADAIQVWMAARQLGLGFFYRWNPAPPEPWRIARKTWASLCRYLVKENKRGLDTEAQIAQAVDRGIYPGKEVLEEWRAQRPTFEPKTEAVWLSTAALDAAARWAQGGPGLIWVEHVEFALALARRTGLRYYGRGGVDELGRPVEQHDPKVPCIVGIQANSAGRNLQAWNRNLIMCPPTNNLTWEQLLGRTHRDGQLLDVTADLWIGCQEHAGGFWQGVQDAQYVADSTGQVQKLCSALVEVPELAEVESRPGARWVR